MARGNVCAHDEAAAEGDMAQAGWQKPGIKPKNGVIILHRSSIPCPARCCTCCLTPILICPPSKPIFSAIRSRPWWCVTAPPQYRPQFERLAAQWPQHGFIWVDIEENPEWLGDRDVEDFPTLLVQGANGRNMFFGTQLPYIGHLERLLKHLEVENAGQDSAHSSPPPLRTLMR